MIKESIIYSAEFQMLIDYAPVYKYILYPQDYCSQSLIIFFIDTKGIRTFEVNMLLIKLLRVCILKV